MWGVWSVECGVWWCGLGSVVVIGCVEFGLGFVGICVCEVGRFGVLFVVCFVVVCGWEWWFERSLRRRRRKRRGCVVV